MRLIECMRRLFGTGKSEEVLKDSNESLPYGNIYESGGGLQCCCPFCEYGVGTQDTFIDGFSSIVVRTCEHCGGKYQSLEITSLPQSARYNWS
jgi:uncharacterized protein (DUF983 family)